MSTACHHSVTLGGNRTFAAPSNQVVVRQVQYLLHRMEQDLEQQHSTQPLNL